MHLIVKSLTDWIRLFQVKGSYILDEYDQRTTVTEMLQTITREKKTVFSPNGNYQRQSVDNCYCVGNGPIDGDFPGIYDYFIGEFS